MFLYEIDYVWEYFWLFDWNEVWSDYWRICLGLGESGDWCYVGFVKNGKFVGFWNWFEIDGDWGFFI